MNHKAIPQFAPVDMLPGNGRGVVGGGSNRDDTLPQAFGGIYSTSLVLNLLFGATIVSKDRIKGQN